MNYVVILKSRHGEVLKEMIGPCTYEQALEVGKDYSDTHDVSMFPLTAPPE